jgi:hypothetical protein
MKIKQGDSLLIKIYGEEIIYRIIRAKNGHIWVEPPSISDPPLSITILNNIK